MATIRGISFPCDWTGSYTGTTPLTSLTALAATGATWVMVNADYEQATETSTSLAAVAMMASFEVAASGATLEATAASAATATFTSTDISYTAGGFTGLTVTHPFGP